MEPCFLLHVTPLRGEHSNIAAPHTPIPKPGFPGYLQKVITMKTKCAITCVVFASLLGSVVALAAEDSDTDRSHPKAFVKDSAVTAKIKASLAAQHLTSVAHIHVDTDQDGVVWLSGTARSQEAIDQAVSIASQTEHVQAVRNNIKIKQDR
jgi:hyperosmotically inducible protein